MVNLSEETRKYILNHLSVKDCLKKGVINYSALSRVILEDLGLPEKKMSSEAILVAARRFKDEFDKKSSDKEIMTLYSNSNIDIKNNIVVFTLMKNVYPESLVEIEKDIKKNNDLFFSIEGTKTITIILQYKNSKIIESKFKNNILKKCDKLVLLTITSEGIESIPGAVAYITSLFFENEINIEEFISCHYDTLIVIKSDNLEKAIKFLKF